MSKPEKEAIETPLRGPVYHSLHKRFIQQHLTIHIIRRKK